MKYNTSALAKLSDISIRTLRYYDQIGLLCPKREENGYRLYDEDDVNKLQQILFYRELGMKLNEIAKILKEKNFNVLFAMENHLLELKHQEKRLNEIIKSAEKTLLSMKGEMKMNDKEKFECFRRDIVNVNEEKYGAEIRQKWGDETIDLSNAKIMNMTEESYKTFESLTTELNKTLKEAVNIGDHKNELSQTLAQLHKKWLSCTWTSYTASAHRSIVEMYIMDDRFKNYYENIVSGGADFLKKAVDYFLDNN